jgi:hypothetical protein
MIPVDDQRFPSASDAEGRGQAMRLAGQSGLSVGFENPVNENGERLIWLDRAVVDRLRSLRGAPVRVSATSFFGWWWRSINGQGG